MKQSIIVTGAGGFLGTAIVKKLLQDGLEIYAALGPGDDPGFHSHDALKKEKVDLMDEEATASYIKKVSNAGSELTAAVLCAGGFSMGPIKDTDSKHLEKMYKLNFITAYNAVRPLLNAFEEKGFGRIFLIGSKPSMNPGEGKNLVAYALSKSLLFRLAEMINAQYKSSNKDIVCSVIAPSILDTKANREAMPDADPADWVPVERVAELVSYVLSPSGKMLREPIFKIYNNM